MFQIDSRPSACSTTISIVASALLGLGVVMVFSASASLTSASIAENPVRNPAVRQAAFNCIALLTALMVGLCPYHSWRIRPRAWFQPAIFLMFITMVFLGLVLVPGIGEVRNGARRWLSFGPSSLGLGFQPSELAKFAVVVFMAAICDRWGERIRLFWTGLLPIVLVIGLAVGMVGIEDFGTAVLLLTISGGILLAARAKVWHLLMLAVPALVAMIQLVLAKPYRLERLMSFLNPDADPQGAGYHQMQSLMTIVSGRIWGQGLGCGIQKYGYLPEGRTDFIFAVICEELGIVGGTAVIALFGILVWQGRRAMTAAPTELGRLLAFGASLLIGVQAAMNIAVVTVSVPTKGIALPMVSAGGTGVIILGLTTGVLINVARYRRLHAGQAVSQSTTSREVSAGLVPAMSGA